MSSLVSVSHAHSTKGPMILAAPHVRAACRRPLEAAAALDTSQTIAATQQLVSFAVFVGAEGLWPRARPQPDAPGSPIFAVTVAGIGATLAATALIQFEATQSAGTIAGLVSAAALMAYYAKRAVDSRGDPSDWPGPKAPLAGMALVSFFVVGIFLEGLR